jgi:hypothetical protein
MFDGGDYQSYWEGAPVFRQRSALYEDTVTFSPAPATVGSSVSYVFSGSLAGLGGPSSVAYQPFVRPYVKARIKGTARSYPTYSRGIQQYYIRETLVGTGDPLPGTQNTWLTVTSQQAQQFSTVESSEGVYRRKMGTRIRFRHTGGPEQLFQRATMDVNVTA